MDAERLDGDQVRAFIAEMPDEVFKELQFTVPWQGSGVTSETRTDPDGMPMSFDKGESEYTREYLQTESWNKFNRNPQVGTAIRGTAGRITGLGFEATSEIHEIHEEILNIEYDPRNRLYYYWNKYVCRLLTEGELFVILTCHKNGFIEVDFLDPAAVSGGGDDDTGIIFHPSKATMPLFFNVSKSGSIVDQIPSIFIARYPDLIDVAKKHADYDRSLQQNSRGREHIFREFKGYKRFIVSVDRGFMTRRAVSYIRAILEWCNFYEDLKRYEIDHKKSSGAYAWVITFEDVKSFKLWVSLSDSEREKTALMQPVVPGSKLFLPPGMKIEPKNPNLPKISDSDTDIMQMIVSGLNESADVTTGTVKGTYAGVKATRGPMSDRTSDEVAYFDRFYKFDFWSSVFFLKSKISGFPEYFEVENAVGFKDGEPIFKKVKRRPEFLIDVSYPTSETVDMESRVKALMGVKHGPLTEAMGLPVSEAAKRLGIGNYGRNRLRKATEDKKYPKPVYSVDAEAAQEKQIEKPKPNKAEIL